MRTHRGISLGPDAALLLTAIGTIGVARLAPAQQPRRISHPQRAATALADTGRPAIDTGARRDVGDLITAATREYQVSGVARTVVQGNFLTFP